MSDSTTATPRVLVVEDEYLIRMLLEDMLADLGYAIAEAVGTIAEASQIAAAGAFDVAILDVNVDGEEVYPACIREAFLEEDGDYVFQTQFFDDPRWTTK